MLFIEHFISKIYDIDNKPTPEQARNIQITSAKIENNLGKLVRGRSKIEDIEKRHWPDWKSTLGIYLSEKLDNVKPQFLWS